MASNVSSKAIGETEISSPSQNSPSPTKRDLSNVHPELHHHAGGDHDVVVADSKVPMWIQDLFEKIFKIKRRGVTIELELYTGIQTTNHNGPFVFSQ